MTSVTVASYNVHYGVGLDGHYDVERIIDAVRDADIICFQEITRGFVANGAADMVAAIEALMPDRYCAFHAPCNIDMGSHINRDGKAVSQRLEFGNMVVSRWPFSSVRGHLLPRRHRTNMLNLQRGMLETVIETPLGTHVYASAHLDHMSAAERLDQIAAVRLLLNGSLRDGNGISGTSSMGLKEPTQPTGFLVGGDFNFEPTEPGYDAITGDGMVDVSATDDGWTWTDGKAPNKRLDYIFCDPAMAAMAGHVWIDQTAVGSDHMPVFVTLSA